MRDGNFTPVTDRRRDVSLDFDRSIQRSDRTGIHLKKKKKNTHYAVTNKIAHNAFRLPKFSHVYRPRDSVPDCDNIVISPSLDGNTVPKISSNFSPRETFVCKRRIKRRRNFLFTKSKRARAVSEFSKRTLAFLLHRTFSRSRAKNVHRTFEYSFLESSIPRGWIVSSCRRFSHLLRTLVSRHDAPSRSPDVSPSCLAIMARFPLPFFLTLRFLSYLHDRWTPCFRCVRVEKGVGSVARIVRTESFFPFLEK